MNDKEIEILQKIFGSQLTNADLKELQSKLALKKAKSAAESELSAVNLGHILPKMIGESDFNEAPAEAAVEMFAAYTEYAKTEVQNVFKSIPALSSIHAYKWCESMEKLFTKFPYSKEILTTSKYDEANFDGCKLDWSYFRFRGHFGVHRAASILDETIISYLKTNELVDCISNNDELSTKIVWEKASSLARDCGGDPISQYFADALAFWTKQTQFGVQEPFGKYLGEMRLRYDEIMIDFMESLGYPVFYFWRKNGASDAAKSLLKILAESHAQYRLCPFPIVGLKTVLDQVMAEKDE